MNRKELTKNRDIHRELREASKPSKLGRDGMWYGLRNESNPIYFPKRKYKK